MIVEYDSNNSGGRWWLEDEDWRALEAAGWTVAWVKGDGMMEKNGRFLGALATSATLVCDSFRDAVLSFEKITGQIATDDGCNCCGPPHRFSTEDPYKSYSGSDILEILHPDRPFNLSKRELLERQS